MRGLVLIGAIKYMTNAGSNTLYKSVPLVVKPADGRARTAAGAQLEHVVMAQLLFAEAQGELCCDSPAAMPDNVLYCVLLEYEL